MFKDKEKQREYDKERMRKKRSRTEQVELDKVEQAPVSQRYITKETAIKLLKVCRALDKEIAGLSGRVNMLDMVWYGNMLMRDVQRELNTDGNVIPE